MAKLKVKYYPPLACYAPDCFRLAPLPCAGIVLEEPCPRWLCAHHAYRNGRKWLCETCGQLRLVAGAASGRAEPGGSAGQAQGVASNAERLAPSLEGHPDQ